jgi:hypothetical protein
MSGNMAFFFDLVALYLVALYLVALYLVALPGGSTWWLYLVHQCAAPCTTLHHQLPPPPISHR